MAEARQQRRLALPTGGKLINVPARVGFAHLLRLFSLLLNSAGIPLLLSHPGIKSASKCNRRRSETEGRLAGYKTALK